MSATELYPTKCTFQRCTDCFDIARRSSAMGHQTTVRRQRQVFIHTRLSRAYLALARLSCSTYYKHTYFPSLQWRIYSILPL